MILFIPRTLIVIAAAAAVLGRRDILARALENIIQLILASSS